MAQVLWKMGNVGECLACVVKRFVLSHPRSLPGAEETVLMRRGIDVLTGTFTRKGSSPLNDQPECVFWRFHNCVRLEFLPSFEGTVLRLVVLAALVVEKLLSHRSTQVKPHGTGKVTNSDQSISQLNLNHLAVRKVVIH